MEIIAITEELRWHIRHICIELRVRQSEAVRFLRVELTRDTEDDLVRHMYGGAHLNPTFYHPRFSGSQPNGTGPMKIWNVDCYIVDRLPEGQRWRVINPMAELKKIFPASHYGVNYGAPSERSDRTENAAEFPRRRSPRKAAPEGAA